MGYRSPASYIGPIQKGKKDMKDTLLISGVMCVGFAWFAAFIRVIDLIRWRYVGALLISGLIMLTLSLAFKNE